MIQVVKDGRKDQHEWYHAICSDCHAYIQCHKSDFEPNRTSINCGNCRKTLFPCPIENAKDCPPPVLKAEEEPADNSINVSPRVLGPFISLLNGLRTDELHHPRVNRRNGELKCLQERRPPNSANSCA